MFFEAGRGTEALQLKSVFMQGCASSLSTNLSIVHTKKRFQRYQMNRINLQDINPKENFLPIIKCISEWKTVLKQRRPEKQ